MEEKRILLGALRDTTLSGSVEWSLLLLLALNWVEILDTEWSPSPPILALAEENLKTKRVRLNQV